MHSRIRVYSHVAVAILTGLTLSLAVTLALSLTPQATGRSQVEIFSPALYTTTFTYTQYLPIVVQQLQLPCDLSGHATLHGAPTNVVLGLSQFITGNKTTIYTTSTDLNGKFCFSNVPVLASCDNSKFGQGYAVQFGYGLEVPSREYAMGWSTPMLSRCQATQVYTAIYAELSDITVLAPHDGITVTLPVTFSWEHPSANSGSYFLSIGSCSPVFMGTATTYILWDKSCEKPWLPTYWNIRQESNNSIWESQVHSLTIQWP